jgi:hypothetical protein
MGYVINIILYIIVAECIQISVCAQMPDKMQVLN